MCLLKSISELTFSQSIDFVVPDDCLRAATEALTQIKSLTQCADGELCEASSAERYSPAGAFHVHIEASDVTVDLYRQSETLWFLPPLDLRLPKCELPPHFVLASDQTVLPPWRPGRGSGVFKSSRHPVVVPKAHVLLEAFMRLHARDAWKRVGTFGMAMIAYVQLYIDNDGLLDTSQLPELLKTFYAELRKGKKPVRQWTIDLRQALGIPEKDSEKDSENDHSSYSTSGSLRPGPAC